MFDVMDAVCEAGNPSRPCEDAVGWGENYCFVMDGASGLSNRNIVDKQSDAAWFAGQVKDKLCRRLEAEEHSPTEEILRDIIGELNGIYCRTAAEKGLEVPEDSPSAGIALFRRAGDRIAFFGLGDCTGVVQLKDGTTVILRDNRLSELDGGVLAKMAEYHRETGISVLKAREICNDLLLANRKKRNQEDGYWILDLSGAGIRHALTAAWQADSVKSIFVCSDGFAQLADTFGLYEDYPALMEAAQTMPLTELCDILFKAQDMDPQANRFPRFKLRDDTSCLWGNILRTKPESR